MPFRILIAPLDWGLGHATRCIPVVRYLLEKGCDVTIAASGPTSLLLADNFPDVRQLFLPGYNIRYSRNGGTFVAKLLFQVPKILRSIRRERRWLQATQATHHFDLIISDNRYGLKINGLKSVIMTHQLQIMTGAGSAADYLLRKLHYRMLEKFDECWVVDQEERNGLGGALSHPGRIPANGRYIGLLSQLRAPVDPASSRDGHIVILLSGPEPMRSIFEEKLLFQIASLSRYNFHIIAGNPTGSPHAHLPPHVTYATHANANELARSLSDAQLVICRSGYSTLMDLAMLGKKALLVPTPGQSEQEYLAGYLQKRGIALNRDQNVLDLKKDIAEALHYTGFEIADDTGKNDQMQEVIDTTLKRLMR